MVLWEITEEDWKSIHRGLKKTRLKLWIGSAMLVCPEQPWLTYNLMLISFSFCIMSFFVLVGAVSLYYARNDILTFVEISHAYGFIISIWVLFLVHYFFKISSLHNIFILVDNDIFHYETSYGRKEDEELKTTVQSYSYLFQNVFHFFVASATVLLVFLAPFLTILFGDESKNRIKEINYNFPVPLWFPFSTDSHLGFVVAYLLMISEIFLVVTYVAATVPFLACMAFELSIQYKILESSIVNLEERALEKYIRKNQAANLTIETIQFDPFYERCVRESLKENILHHIQISRFFNLYQDITSSMYGVIIGLSMTILASLSLVLTKTQLLSVDTLKFAFFFIIELVTVFGYCIMGTFLTEASKMIPDALYNCPWFNLSSNQKRTLRIFQYRSQKNVELKGSGLFVINLQLFVQIVRTTYSIFNIFSTMGN